MKSENIEEFIRHWQEAFGERLSERDARLRVHRLVKLYEILADRRGADGGQTPRQTQITDRRGEGLGDVGDVAPD